VELAGLLAGLAVYWQFGFTLTGLLTLLFLVDLLAVALIDWQHMIIPHTLTAGGMVCGVIFSLASGLGWFNSLLGGAAGAGVILLLSHGYQLVRGQPGMGGGDVMLMAMVGTFLGLQGVILVLFGGACLGSLYALVGYRASLSGQSKLPFGTFLAAAAMFTLFGAEPLLQWYLGLLMGEPV
jgi:leader peptidase (prepilin peptidase)/N-methyltransferase